MNEMGARRRPVGEKASGTIQVFNRKPLTGPVKGQLRALTQEPVFIRFAFISLEFRRLLLTTISKEDATLIWTYSLYKYWYFTGASDLIRITINAKAKVLP